MPLLVCQVELLKILRNDFTTQASRVFTAKRPVLDKEIASFPRLCSETTKTLQAHSLAPGELRARLQLLPPCNCGKAGENELLTTETLHSGKAQFTLGKSTDIIVPKK